MLTIGEIAAFITAAGGVALGLLSWVRSRRVDKVEEWKASVEGRETHFAADIALNEYIDKRVETLVTYRLQPIQEQLEAERRTLQATRRVVHALVKQWPAENVPVLDPADIALIEDDLPPHWVRRHKSA